MSEEESRRPTGSAVMGTITAAFAEKAELDAIAAEPVNICYYCKKPTGKADWVTEVTSIVKTYKRVHESCVIAHRKAEKEKEK